MGTYVPPLAPQNFIHKVGPVFDAPWGNAVDAILQGSVPATGTYTGAFVSGAVQLTGPNGIMTSYGDLTFGLNMPNPSGVPCPGLLVGGAGKVRSCIVTDAQTPGLTGIQLIIAAGEVEDGQVGGQLLAIGGASNTGKGGDARWQGGTSLNGAGGDTYVQGGNATTAGKAGNLYLSGGLTGNGGGGDVHLIMTATGGGTVGSVVVRVNSTVLYTITSTGAIFIGASGAGLPGQVLVSSGPSALPQWVTTAASGVLYPTTDAENIAGVTPVNFNINNVTADVRRYGADPTGTVDSTVAFQNAVAVAAAGNIELSIPSGTYSISSTLQWGVQGLQVRAYGEVFLNFSNPLQCITVDGGAAGSGIVGVRIEGFIKVTGNAATTDAWFFRACHHAHIEDIRAGSCTTGFRLNWCVCSVFEGIACSSNEAAFSALVPTTGLVLDQRESSGHQTSTCTFINAMMEGITNPALGSGIDLLHAIGCTFVGGTSEGNLVGIRQIGTDNLRNSFIGTDLESNVTNDILVTGGNCLKLDNIISVSTNDGIHPNIDVQGGNNTMFIGGFLRWVHVATSPAATGTTFYSSQVSDTSSVGIKLDAGADIETHNVQLVNTLGVVTGKYLPPVAGFGVPTGPVVISNFPGATASLVQTSQTVAEILTILKNLGVITT